MVIRAPQDGIVYYGRCEHGTWVDKAKSDAQLRAGGTLAVNQVVMTIVAPRPLTVRGNLAESELYHVATGTPALITPKAFPNETVTGKVARISSIPISDSDFDCQLSVDDDALPESVLPGMACKIKLRVVDQKAAIMIPAAAVFTDDNEAPYVYVVEPNDRSQKRSVVRGEKQGSDVQIVNGLEPDEKILLEQPKDPSDE
jgi:multidrug efflux pump subunit AcrA (membrane-fusion protein)